MADKFIPGKKPLSFGDLKVREAGITDEDVYNRLKDLKESETKDFLEKISAIESSGGKNVNHRTIASGIHAGDAAIGQYGLMPNTLKELAARKAESAIGTTEEIDAIKNLDNDKIKEYLSTRPDIAEQLGQDLADRVLDKTENDDERAAYMWLKGHNKNPQDITETDLDDSFYVDRFRKLKEKMK